MLTHFSPPPSFKPPSMTRISIRQRKKSSLPAWTEAQLTKMTRALTRTSSQVPTPMWPRSMTRHTRAAEATRRWRMGTMGKAARMNERRSPRRRRSRRRSDGQGKGGWNTVNDLCIAKALIDSGTRERGPRDLAGVLLISCARKVYLRSK